MTSFSFILLPLYVALPLPLKIGLFMVSGFGAVSNQCPNHSGQEAIAQIHGATLKQVVESPSDQPES